MVDTRQYLRDSYAPWTIINRWLAWQRTFETPAFKDSFSLIFTSRPVGGQSIAISVHVCMSVYPLAYLKNLMSQSIFCTCGPGSVPVLLWRRSNMSCTSGFLDVMFSHKRCAFPIRLLYRTMSSVVLLRSDIGGAKSRCADEDNELTPVRPTVSAERMKPLNAAGDVDRQSATDDKHNTTA